MLDQDVLAATGHGRGDAKSKPIRCGVKVVGRTGGGGGGTSPRQQRLHDSYYCSEHDSCTDGARHTEGSNLPQLPMARERSVGDKTISH